MSAFRQPRDQTLRLSGNLQRHLFVQGFTGKLIKKGTTACKLDFHRSPFEAQVHTGRAALVHTGRASGYQAYDESSTTSFLRAAVCNWGPIYINYWHVSKFSADVRKIS